MRRSLVSFLLVLLVLRVYKDPLSVSRSIFIHLGRARASTLEELL